MTKPTTPLFMVTLRHLSPDGKKAGVELPSAQLNYLSPKQLRTLLNSVAELAPTVAYPAEPEMRVEGPAGKFVVQVKAGRLNLVSWSSAQKGGALSTAEIFAAITGEEGVEPSVRHDRKAVAQKEASPVKQKIVMFLLSAAIVGVNTFTVWFITQPPRTLLPKYRLMAPEPAERLLGEVAGVYETGTAPGDRRLEIKKSGDVSRIKYGADRSVKDQQSFTVLAAEVASKPALVTSKKSLISIKDPLSVVLYGDTYTRVPK
jgi:hypothetical protein